MKHLKPGDFLILLIIIAIAITSIIFSIPKNKDCVHIQAEGIEYQYSLSKDGIYEIPGLIGITKIEIKEGKIRIIDSPCPNKTCVKQGWGTTLICLPNNVICTVESSGGYDAIAE